MTLVHFLKTKTQHIMQYSSNTFRWNPYSCNWEVRYHVNTQKRQTNKTKERATKQRIQINKELKTLTVTTFTIAGIRGYMLWNCNTTEKNHKEHTLMAWVQKKANQHKLIQMKDITDIKTLKSIHTAYKSFKVHLIALGIKLSFI